MAFLIDCKVKDLFRENYLYDSLLYINEKTTIEECLNLLVSKNILAVPIYDQSKQQFIGIIDFYQIMTWMGFVAYTPDGEMSLEMLQQKVNLMQPAANLLGVTGKQESDDINSLWVLNANDSFKDPLEYLGKGIYRILVTSEDQTDIQHIKMVTQTDLTRFILKNWEKFDNWKNCTLNDPKTVGIRFLKKVFTISSTEPAIKAFQKMRLKQVNALAVVNDKGVLIDTLSDADLRGFTGSNLQNLFVPVKDWIGQVTGHGGVTRKVVTCHSMDSLHSVIESIVNKKIHRVWIVDEEHKPIGVVSMTDVALFVSINTMELWNPPDE